MAYHPVNLGVRFLLEMATLVALGFGVASLAGGILGVIIGIMVVLVASALWGTFRVPNDKSASGNAPIPVKGMVRLLLELGFFTSAVAALIQLDQPSLAIALAVITLIHYATSYDRIQWLLEQ